ncbi:MAG: threonine synthase [Spirochaetes bacterium RIFOXYC1_FULL_54_7]|nr:MAG: threonine synthase [Spirochaetes bacterium RIFOXYC1_FULL_54_7]
MKFISTRGACASVSAAEAILAGLAPDGGLYVPESFPTLSKQALEPGKPYASRVALALAPFFSGDPLEDKLRTICEDAFSFPVPMVDLGTTPAKVLELFHGPTAAFKDFGARFLARCMEALVSDTDKSPGRLAGSGYSDGDRLTILVATSGDTGGAVAAAFHRRKRISVRVLFPENGVSGRQQKQLTCWGDNVRSYAVRGDFDDCQRVVKEAFQTPLLVEKYRLSSANSINLGRLLPQAAYYIHASVEFLAATGGKPLLVIPSGNVGNAVGAYWARMMGAPIGDIVMAVNANRTIPDFLESGEYRPRPGIKTIANAMDVGAPSNLERLRALYPDTAGFRREVRAWSVSDEQLRQTIRRVYDESGYVLCPHTAAGEWVRQNHFPDEAAILVSTAHPAKFETVVEPLIGRQLEVPEALAALLDAPGNFETIKPELGELFP